MVAEINTVDVIKAFDVDAKRKGGKKIIAVINVAYGKTGFIMDIGKNR